MFDSSADDYLYLYDLDNDYYYMSVHATEKFPLERNEFNNVIEEYRKICYPEDFSMLEQELKGIISGKITDIIFSIVGLIKSGIPCGLTAEEWFVS